MRGAWLLVAGNDCFDGATILQLTRTTTPILRFPRTTTTLFSLERDEVERYDGVTTKVVTFETLHF